MKFTFLKYITIFFLSSTLFSACETAFLKDADNSSLGIFDQVWTFANERYSFFDYKKIDWNAVKTKYRAKVTNEMKEEALFNVCADMLNELRDGHVNLATDFNRSRNWTWYLDYPQNFNAGLLERNYWQNKELQVGSVQFFDFGDVGYIYYGDFSGDVSHENMNFILDKCKDKKGMIIDVRDNNGGSVSNVGTIASHFTNTEILAGTERFKTGTGKNDFGKAEKVKITPTGEKNTKFTQNIVLLTNRSCYSATNRFVFVMREFPNVTVMGDHTGGGGGFPTMQLLSNGWRVRVSTSQLIDNNNINVEDGIDPDIKVEMKQSDENAGKDTILEEALKLLRK